MIELKWTNFGRKRVRTSCPAQLFLCILKISGVPGMLGIHQAGSLAAA
jgi:hypothetical protein